MLTTILIIILILVLLGAVPAWPYSRGWGYGPSGIVGLILVILLILLLLGKDLTPLDLRRSPTAGRASCARRSKNSAWLTRSPSRCRADTAW